MRQGRKHLPDDIGDLRMSLGILLDARRASVFDLFGELVGHFGDERFDVDGDGFGDGFHNSASDSPLAASSRWSLTSARPYRLRTAS